MVIEEILGLVVLLGMPVALASGSVVLAMVSAPRDRRTPVNRGRLLWGAVLATVGLSVMVRIAWATHEERYYYGDLEPIMYMMIGLMGGVVLFLGLGSFTSWALTLPAKLAVRLPRPLRLPARQLAGHPPGTAGGAATTMLAIGVATAVMIVAAAQTAQDRAQYLPQAPPGALFVEVYSAEEARAVRADLRQEIPSAPIVQSEDTVKGYLSYDDDGSSRMDAHIGDQALLSYLTGDPATSYDEGTAVLITAEDAVTSLEIDYALDDPPGENLSRTVPAITVRPEDPRRTDLFIPAKLVTDLGFSLEPDKLLIDPSFHRVSAAEQDRLDRRLGEFTGSYVERGFEASTGWLYVFGAIVLVALGGVLTAAVSAAGSLRWRRVLLRVAGGSGVTLRLLVACRAWLIAVCGTALGAAAGCVTGLLLAWPKTVQFGGDPLSRVAFDTPWLPIAALVVGLPVLAAAFAALLPAGSPATGQAVLTAPPSIR